MKNSYHFFAFDLGATSGRSIVATLEDGEMKLKELTRFSNKILRIDNKCFWNIYSLFDELKRGLQTAQSEGYELDAIGIDTWGVDFAYIAQDGSLLSLPRSYRDLYTNGIPEEFFKIITRKEVYEASGIQIMNFNSLYQFYAAQKEEMSALQHANAILFMPDALSYLLTGQKVCEYTIASTSQMLNPRTKTFEQKLLEPIRNLEALIQPIVMPGTMIGKLKDSLQKECGVGDIPVIAVAGHDTASAVVAVPAENENFAYLSSGTWSLMGIETKEPIITDESFELNFTNEGGVEGTTRFLKNITGMWLLEQCRKEWKLEGATYSYPEIVQMSDSVAGFQFLIDPDDAVFANPENMTKAIADYCQRTEQKQPQTHAEFVRCIFDSLALKYKYVLNSLQKLSPFAIEKLYIIGGGSQNKLLNQATANAIGIPVVAGPAEATALGNVMMQTKGLGLFNSLDEIRSVVRQSVEMEYFYPENTEAWQTAYRTFLSILKK